MDVRSTIETLRTSIKNHNIKYYALSSPSISDAAYDELMRRLRLLESKYPEHYDENSPSNTVGAIELTKGFKKITRTKPMLSLQDVFTFESITKFVSDCSTDIDYVLEQKIDGLGVELLYEYGALVKASTRGDGLTGEDVTNNVLAISDIPVTIPTKIPRIEIRGEVYMKDVVLSRINKDLVAKGLEPYANTRNLASGSLKQLDPKVTAERELSFFAYTLGEYEGITFKTQVNVLDTFLEWGFKVSKFALASSLELMYMYINALADQRHDLGYAIDGVVIKVNDFGEQERLGYRSNNPKWAVAYKYPPEQVRTQVVGCTWQVGRTGALTPVAEVTPVSVGGTTVSRITLHNRLEIERKDIRIGDYVFIHRAGDVIPEIVNVDIISRTTSVRIIDIPTHCPECNTPVVLDPTFIRCVNTDCKAAALRRFTHYVSRDAANIDGLSSQLLSQLINEGLVTKFSDLYTLHRDDLVQLDRFGEKKAENLLRSVIVSKNNTTLPRVLYALGISNVGHRTAYDIAAHFSTIENIMNASIDELLVIPNIGDTVAESVHTYFKHNADAVRELIYTHLPCANAYIKKSVSKEDLALQDISFLFTGSFEKFARKDAESFVVSKGGTVASSVSKNLKFLVVGDKPGSKLAKATTLGIPILYENDFIIKVGM